MKRQELIIEHFQNNRLVKMRRFKDSSKITFGSSLTAHVRISGPTIHGIHAMVEADESGWMVYDLAQVPSVKVNNEPHLEKRFESSTEMIIGDHLFRMTPQALHDRMFQNTESQQGEKMHQVVHLVHDQVLESYLLPAHQAHSFKTDSGTLSLQPPAQHHVWNEVIQGSHTFMHRVTFVKDLKPLEKGYEIDPAEKKMLMAMGGLLIVMMASTLFMNFKSKGHAKEENKFNQIIYDAKVTKEKKEESQKVAKQFKQKELEQPKVQKTQVAAAPSASENKAATKKVLTNIKAAQLGKMLGRISLRASRSVAAVGAVGVAIGDKPSTGAAAGAGLPTVSGVAGAVGNGQLANSRYKLAAVGTSGKGGGSGDLKGVGGLKAAKVGAADVGIVEEETEIDGGLDREIIAQYIKSQLGQIRYCYERQLSANPDLYGKVQVQFVIAGTGDVGSQSIGVSTLKNAMVEGCILRRVAGWKFPTPKGGTQVKVTYPFLFKSTN